MAKMTPELAVGTLLGDADTAAHSAAMPPLASLSALETVLTAMSSLTSSAEERAWIEEARTACTRATRAGIRTLPCVLRAASTEQRCGVWVWRAGVPCVIMVSRSS